MYKVNDYEGKDKYFYDKKDAKEYRDRRRREMHNKFCVEKHVPSYCLCLMSKGREECAAHCYAKTMAEHAYSGCPLRDDMGVEEIEIE